MDGNDNISVRQMAGAGMEGPWLPWSRRRFLARSLLVLAAAPPLARAIARAPAEHPPNLSTQGPRGTAIPGNSGAVQTAGTADNRLTTSVFINGAGPYRFLVDTGSEHAIIDITGVAAVDTQVAQHLLKTVQAARLLGAECIVSGIRPQIAQTVVALGIEFGDIQTKANLSDAMLLAMRRSGLDIVGRA